MRKVTVQQLKVKDTCFGTGESSDFEVQEIVMQCSSVHFLDNVGLITAWIDADQHLNIDRFIMFNKQSLKNGVAACALQGLIDLKGGVNAIPGLRVCLSLNDEEGFYDNGMADDYNISLLFEQAGLSKQDALKETPIGKLAVQLGYSEVIIERHHSEMVDFSFVIDTL